MTGPDIAEFGDERLPAHFWSKVVEDPSGCWLWTAYINHQGYGKFGVNRRLKYAHRVSYAALVGGLPDWTPTGLQLDHLCRVRHCVNPDHLELVLQRVNLLRGDTLAARELARTHCPRGHPLSGENLAPWAMRRGARACMTCNRLSANPQAAAIREAHAELGMTWREYVATYGHSTKTALAISKAIGEATLEPVILDVYWASA